MGLMDALTGRIAKHNSIKEEGAKFLFSCAEKYEKGSYLYDHYVTLGDLYISFCPYLFGNPNTPSYKKNINAVKYDYMMKFMVSIVTCELFRLDDVSEFLINEGLDVESFTKKIAEDCQFSEDEKKLINNLAVSYKNKSKDNFVYESSILGFSKYFYGKSVQIEPDNNEVMAIASTKSFLITSYFKANEQVRNS